MSTMTTIPDALVIEPGPTGAELPPVLDTRQELLDAVMRQPAARIAAALYETRTTDLPVLLDRLDRPLRIQLRRTRGWRKPDGAVKVDRTTRWGNPFRVDAGTVYGPPWFQLKAVWSRPRILAEYSLYITFGGANAATVESAALAHSVDSFNGLLGARRRDEPARFEDWIAPLRGADLACWCPLGQPCHADVLLEIANGGDPS
jgi:hypothetical protein